MVFPLIFEYHYNINKFIALLESTKFQEIYSYSEVDQAFNS